ncbi:hypothetical protein ACFSTH_11705 [Paenibacillus yanchengensis]|uniref:J domain-containing protein n=1 Tax=Paenibacillus yanchengensis TaxID=2035833 RepID=A0ABW4YRN0_9BACL
MFCVIQKLFNKRTDPYGAYKELVTYSDSYTINGKAHTKYRFHYGGERFERHIRDAYKIMIHKSYREAGKVKKKQWVICTMGYYSLLDSWPGDCIISSVLEEKLTEMGIDEGQLWEMVYKKLDPLIERVKAEFIVTEEYQTKQRHKQLIAEYQQRKKEFDSEYGSDTYEYCYDLYGELQNPAYLKELEDALRQRQQYQESSYQRHSNSNYGYEEFENFFNGSYSKANRSNYTDDEKVKLKKMFRYLTKTFHPDVTKDDGEMMKLINKLKDDWEI